MPSFRRRHGKSDTGDAHKPSSAKRATLAVALALVAVCALSASARQQPATSAQQQQITQAQADLYERWRSNINLNQMLAHEAGRDYLGKYPEPGEYAARVRRWVSDYERESRKLEFLRLFKQQKFSDLFRVGDQILAEEPEHLKTIIHLAYAGYLAAGKGDDSYSDAARTRAQQALLLADSGRASDWQPFADRADALGHLHFVIGELTVKSDPEESVRLFRRAVEIGGTVKGTPVLYSRLAAAYVVGRYDPLSKDYKARFEGKEESQESLAALEKINSSVDLIVDAYARAVSLAGDDARYTEAKRRWVEELTALYKFRHKGTTDGLDAFVAGVAAKPLPE